MQHRMVGILVLLGALLIAGGCSTATSAESTDTKTVADTASTTAPLTTEPISPATTAVVEEKAVESTTTTSASALDIEAVAFAEGLIADLNAGDIDAVIARFPDSIDLRSTTVTMESPSNFAAYGAAMESTWELDECKTLVGGTTRCVWLRTSAHEPYSPESKSVVIQFRLESGVPAYAEFTLPNDPSVGPESDFTNWMFENHPSEAHQLYFDNGDAGYYEQRMTKPLEEAELKKEYVPLWQASLEG